VSDGGSFPAIEALLPHRGDMLLIDRVTAADGERLSTEARVRPDAWYADAAGNMPAWIGIELMAQTIAAYIGLEHQCEGKPVKVGFLLGTRKFLCTVPAFERNAKLAITVCEAYREVSGLAAFDCYIIANGERVAEATIKVFEPNDPQQFIAAIST
jgi:predicted hotdog family 3-hydroxylacyl-ACP dehydratase